MVNPYGKFSEPGFPHNFAKNDRQDLESMCEAPLGLLRGNTKLQTRLVATGVFFLTRFFNNRRKK
jgi:hypothetical protein